MTPTPKLARPVKAWAIVRRGRVQFWTTGDVAAAKTKRDLIHDIIEGDGERIARVLITEIPKGVRRGK